MINHIRRRIMQEGPLSFAEFQTLALYGENGFFAGNGRVGRSGDFVTSPTLGSVFAQVLGNALDVWWADLGYPVPFEVVECGGADGILAKAISHLALACSDALRYSVVEFTDELPATPITGVILANELLDNLPVSLFEWNGEQWNEVRVAIDAADELCEVLCPASVDVVTRLDDLVEAPPLRGRVPLQTKATSWLASAISCLKRGRVVCIDYMRTTPEFLLLAQEQWLRTYRGHRPGVHPLREVGRQDITCDVALDQLLTMHPTHPTVEVLSQKEFLLQFGIEEIRQDAERQWRAGAASGGLEALKARSTADEAFALVDELGFGGFFVCQWPVVS